MCPVTVTTFATIVLRTLSMFFKIPACASYRTGDGVVSRVVVRPHLPVGCLYMEPCGMATSVVSGVFCCIFSGFGGCDKHQVLMKSTSGGGFSFQTLKLSFSISCLPCLWGLGCVSVESGVGEGDVFEGGGGAVFYRAIDDDSASCCRRFREVESRE